MSESLAKNIENRVLLRSRDRVVGTPSAAAFQIGRTFQNATQVELLHFSMSNTIYNLRGYLFTLRIGATLYSITLPDGNYTAPTFFTQLQTAISTITGVAFTVTLDPVTQRLTIASAGVFDLLFTDAIAPQATPPHVLVTIGFDRQDYLGLNSYTAPRVYSLSQPDHLVIRLPTLASSRLFTTQGSSGAFVVPVNVNFGSQIVFDSNSNFPQILHLVNSSGISNFTVEVVDDFGRNLPNIADDWSMILRIMEDGISRPLG